MDIFEFMAKKGNVGKQEQSTKPVDPMGIFEHMARSIRTICEDGEMGPTPIRRDAFEKDFVNWWMKKMNALLQRSGKPKKWNYETAQNYLRRIWDEDYVKSAYQEFKKTFEGKANEEHAGKLVYEIKPEDVGKSFTKLYPQLGTGWGVVQKIDVGKRLYKDNDVIQMENEEQKNKRLGQAKEGKAPIDKDKEQVKIKKLTEDSPAAPDDEKPEPGDTTVTTPQGGEEEAPEITKEYLGNTEDTHYYMIKTEDGADLQIVDQEGVKKFSAKDHNIDPTDVIEFLKAVIQELEVDQITRNIFVKYILPKLEEEERIEQEEEEAERARASEKPEAGPKVEKPELEPEEEEPLESKKVDTKDGKVNEDDESGIRTGEKEYDEKGKEIAGFLNLKPDKEGRYKTEWGTKTAVGLYLSLKGIITGETEESIKSKVNNLIKVFEGKIEDITVEQLKKLLTDGEDLIKKAKAVNLPTPGVESVVLKVKSELDKREKDKKSEKIKEKRLSDREKLDIAMELLNDEQLKDFEAECRDQEMAEAPKLGMKPLPAEEAKAPVDKDKEQVKIKKLIEMIVNDGEHEFDVNLIDDGTLDTVIDINGKEFRFDQEFAEMWWDEDGTLSEEGLKELALDALSNIEPEEYDELVAGVKEPEASDDEIKKGLGEEQPKESKVVGEKKSRVDEMHLSQFMEEWGIDKDTIDKLSDDLWDRLKAACYSNDTKELTKIAALIQSKNGAKNEGRYDPDVESLSVAELQKIVDDPSSTKFPVILARAKAEINKRSKDGDTKEGKAPQDKDKEQVKIKKLTEDDEKYEYLFGTYSALGYSIFGWKGDEFGDAIELYSAGNCKDESSGTVDPASADALPIDTIKQFAEQTGKEMAKDYGVEWNGAEEIPEEYTKESKIVGEKKKPPICKKCKKNHWPFRKCSAKESKIEETKAIAWKVMLNGEEIDTVFDEETDPVVVKKSLVDHDNYDPNIEVVKETRENFDSFVNDDELQAQIDDALDSEDLDEAKLEGKGGKKLKAGAKRRHRGKVVFPWDGPKVSDKKDHFPINDAGQARNALARSHQYKGAPKWYKGSLSELQNAVKRAVKKEYPSIEVSESENELDKDGRGMAIARKLLGI